MSKAGSGQFDFGNDDWASSNTLASTALIIGEQALNLLQNAANYVPVPGIAVAAGVALSIVNIVQNVRSNKDDFISIGKDSCVIVVTVIQRVNISQAEQFASASLAILQQDADQLVADMKTIEACVKKHRKRSLVKRLLNHQADQDVVQECRDRLQHAITLFGLYSDIEVRKQLAQLSSQLATLLEQQTMSQPPLQMPEPHVPQLHTPQPHTPQPHTSQPQFRPPAPHKSARSEARAARRQARDETQQNQQFMNVAMGGPGGLPNSGSNSFANVQNHVGPGANITYSYVGGDQHNNNRDDSFNVNGSGHNINFSFAR